MEAAVEYSYIYLFFLPSRLINRLSTKQHFFLNGKLHEGVYMPPSPGRSVSSHLVSRLRKALYGLKQANSGSKAREGPIIGDLP